MRQGPGLDSHIIFLTFSPFLFGNCSDGIYVSSLLFSCPNHSNLLLLMTIAISSTVASSKISSFLRCYCRFTYIAHRTSLISVVARLFEALVIKPKALVFLFFVAIILTSFCDTLYLMFGRCHLTLKKRCSVFSGNLSSEAYQNKTMCIMSVCIYTLLKVVGYYDLSVLSMSVGRVSSIQFFWDFWNFSNFVKPLSGQHAD